MASNKAYVVVELFSPAYMELRAIYTNKVTAQCMSVSSTLVLQDVILTGKPIVLMLTLNWLPWSQCTSKLIATQLF